jgi:uncharacterized protein (UPF0276 family)
MTHPHHSSLGFGLGLRIPHYAHILEHKPKVDWFEIISENFMDTGGRAVRKLEQFRELYPIVMHGVALSIGTCDPVNSEYMHKLKALKNWLKPAWISDHLCWTGIAHKNTHDLLPVPYTEESLKHITQRIRQVQDFLETPIALENPSTYLEFKSSQMPEAEFIARMASDSGCNLLLDINNVYVTCFNHRLDAKTYLDTLPLDHVIQIHLSGHSNMGTHIIDTHDDHVTNDVWALYKYTVHKAGRAVNTMIEWDDHIPEFSVLFAELEKAKTAAMNAQHYGALAQLALPQAQFVPHIITPLVESQTHMQTAILDGAHGSPDAWIRSKENFTPAEQLGVYINGYRYRLYNVTAEDYPVLKYAVGAQLFDSLLNDFVNTVRSAHFNIAHYTVLFAQFLASQSQINIFAREIAQLESTIAQLTDAPETTALTPEHLAGITPDNFMEMHLYARKALQLLAFTYPINAFYKAVKEDAGPSLPAHAPTHMAVFRHEDTVWRMELEANEYHLLQHLFNGTSIGDALEKTQTDLCLSDDILMPKLSAWFGRWMRNGLLRANEVGDITPSRSAA